MANPNIKSRQDMLRRVVYPGWGLLGLLVLLIDPLMKINLVLGAGVGAGVVLINLVNSFRVAVFIRQGYREAAKNDHLLQTLNLPVRTVPVVLVIGSVGLALYLSYALVSLAVLAKYSFGENISGPLIIFALIQFALLAPLYFVMDKKLTDYKK